MNSNINKKTSVTDLGLIDYKEAWDYQSSLFEKILAIKAGNRDLPEHLHKATDNFLLFCQHPHVYTLGKSGKENNFLLKEDELKNLDASYYHINRGGDITYHGPGQIVGYPVIDLENFFTDIHQYMRFLEEAVILTLKEYDVEAGRIPGLTGVWIDYTQDHKARKICALGVKTSRWVAMHGFALNVNPDLSYFNHIIPCGITDKAVTSLQQELGRPVDVIEVQGMLQKHIARLFEMEIINN
ncbi:lipoyl(octanoyl) transferase LipB [Chryseolinea lacunae]|uniref:Octanoyltransferase n=1 Tax=Chryseolinea lacunae TaxID=2801331 RepID=A0ABS1KQZ4_9BACT|nr:lipoyl(octanoyl) transferase LipB [Chryseolinea lacunae]